MYIYIYVCVDVGGCRCVDMNVKKENVMLTEIFQLAKLTDLNR